MPVLHLIAGPNGAGKSTLYRCLLAPRYPALPFVNPQAYEQEHLQHLPTPEARALAAREWADAQRQALLRASRPFVTETALSTHRAWPSLRKPARWATRWCCTPCAWTSHAACCSA
jgi:predicted ABC-type ATPase